jgi:hypothetical protein
MNENVTSAIFYLLFSFYFNIALPFKPALYKKIYLFGTRPGRGNQNLLSGTLNRKNPSKSGAGLNLL